MGFKFDEKALINNNIFKYEDKLNTQYTRFLDKTPTYVTYYNISTVESTVDLGFSNVEKILGSNSPIRFNEVNNLPIYGMEAIQLAIEEDEEGLDTNYDGELIILPDTIKPYPNDFFILEHRKRDLLFQVTGVEYDTIKSNNFYKISFTIKYTDPEDVKKILKQVSTKYTCVVDNIGTEDKCIIENEEYDLLKKLQTIYNEISERYLMYFYNNKYNSIVYVDVNRNTIYDRYINHFIQKHGLIYDKDTHKCIYLMNQDNSCSFNIEYDRSIFKAYEVRKPKRINSYYFSLNEINDYSSVFKYYNTQNCKSVRFANGKYEYYNSGFINALKSGELEPHGPIAGYDKIQPIYYLQDNIPKCNYTNFTEMEQIIIKYLHDKIESIYSINMEDLEDEAFFDITWDNYVKIPLLLYALKGYYKLFVQKQLSN